MSRTTFFAAAAAALLAVIPVACDGTDGADGRHHVEVKGDKGGTSSTKRPTATPSASEPATPPPSIPPGNRSVNLTRLPPKALRVCSKGKPLEAACPRRLPETAGPSYLVESFGAPTSGFEVLELSYGAARNNRPELNRPPDFGHVVVEAGHPERLIPLGQAVDSDRPIGEKLLLSQRRQPLLLDEVTWGGRRGSLVLAQSFPAGGAHADHLVFRWSGGGTEKVMSLHVWTPVTESRATLRRMVESIED